jgi:hypothetical protein
MPPTDKAATDAAAPLTPFSTTSRRLILRATSSVTWLIFVSVLERKMRISSTPRLDPRPLGFDHPLVLVRGPPDLQSFFTSSLICPGVTASRAPTTSPLAPIA